MQNKLPKSFCGGCDHIPLSRRCDDCAAAETDAELRTTGWETLDGKPVLAPAPTKSAHNTDPNRFTPSNGFVWMWRWRTENGSVWYDTRAIPEGYQGIVERLRVTPGTGERKWVECTS